MTRRDLILKWTMYGAALALIAIVNYCVLTYLPLDGVPLMLPAMAVAVGILEGARAGAGFGIAAGVVQAAAVHGSPLWVAALSAVGWLCGLLAQYVLRRDIVGYLLACLTGGLAYGLIQVGWHSMEGAAPAGVLFRVAVPEFFWTMVFALPVYWVSRFCCRHYGRIYHE